MANRSDIDHRTWFVTGASSGFGEAICKEALAHGDSVVATSRDPASLGALVDDDHVTALALDVTDPDAANAALGEAAQRHGLIDAVFNNAGYGHVGAAEELSDDELRRQIDVNLLGVINVTRAALPHLRRQRSGHLLQMSSLNGVEGMAGGSYYVASKFAIEGFSESVAEEVEPLGIKVTIIQPGPHGTAFLNERRMKSSEPIADYAGTVGQARDAVSEFDGKQPGDPARAAQAIVQVVESPDPPRRLPLGTMAVERIRSRLTHRLEELDRVAELSVTSDFPQ